MLQGTASNVPKWCSVNSAEAWGALELREAAHLYGATEGHLAITLAEVHVPHRQLGALHKHCTATPLTALPSGTSTHDLLEHAGSSLGQ